MSPSYIFQFQSNAKEKEESQSGDVEHTTLEREVADIIIHLLHRQDSLSNRPLDSGFPKWSNKRKRSVHPISQISFDSCPNLIRDDFKSRTLEYEERGFVYWPEWSGREFVVPDLNMSAEDLAAAAVAEEMRRRQEEIYAVACRRMAAADARRKRKELQRMKNSIAAHAPLCSRVFR